METGYQRSKIQESRCTTRLKAHRRYPIIGVNTFRNPHGEPVPRASSWRAAPKRSRASSRLADFHACHARRVAGADQRLQQAVIDNGNVFGADGRGALLQPGARSPTPCSRWAGSTGAA